MSQRVPTEIKWLQDRGYVLEREEGNPYDPKAPVINKANPDQNYFVMKAGSGNAEVGPGPLSEIVQFVRNNRDRFPVSVGGSNGL